MLSLTDKHKKLHLELMSFAVHIMYECAMRRQDANSLTWGHFKQENHISDDGYDLKFKSKKNGKTRIVSIHKRLHQWALRL